MAPDSPYRVETSKRSDFAYETAVARLSLLRIDEIAWAYTPDHHGDIMLRLQTVVDLTSVAVVGAVGALLGHCIDHAIINQLDANMPPTIRAIRPLPIDNIMQVDAITTSALGIFVDEFVRRTLTTEQIAIRATNVDICFVCEGPSTARLHKEGHSIFGQLNRTMSYGGKKLLHQWLTYPSTDVQIIQRRLDHIQWFLHPQSREIAQQINLRLKKVKDLVRKYVITIALRVVKHTTHVVSFVVI